jgi:hypothetical protein
VFGGALTWVGRSLVNHLIGSLFNTNEIKDAQRK